MNWCEHMEPGKVIPYFFRLEPGKSPDDPGMWMFCPICGTPRPKQQKMKSLSEKIYDIIYEPMQMDDYVSKKALTAILQAIREASPEPDVNWCKDSQFYIGFDYCRNQMLEKLK